MKAFCGLLTRAGCMAWLLALAALVPVGRAEEVAPGATEKKAAAEIDELMTTLNQSLEENRDLRKELQDLEAAYRRVAVENNVLSSQLRQIQEGTIPAAEQAKAEQQGHIQELEQDLTRKKEAYEQAVRARAAERRRHSGSRRKLAVLRREKARLSGTLSMAILEGERATYLELIRGAQESGTIALQEISAAKSENERLKQDLVEMHFQLGNVLFERKDYPGAVRQYQGALALDPEDPWSHHNVAVVYDYYLDDNPSAIHHYGKFLRLQPLAEEARRIRERVLELELFKSVIPGPPLALDFNRSHKKLR